MSSLNLWHSDNTPKAILALGEIRSSRFRVRVSPTFGSDLISISGPFGIGHRIEQGEESGPVTRHSEISSTIICYNRRRSDDCEKSAFRFAPQYLTLPDEIRWN